MWFTVKNPRYSCTMIVYHDEDGFWLVGYTGINRTFIPGADRPPFMLGDKLELVHN